MLYWGTENQSVRFDEGCWPSLEKIFDICICLWNHHYNQNNENIYHPQKFLVSLCNPSFSIPPSSASLGRTSMYFVSVHMSLHLLEFYAKGIIQYIVTFVWLLPLSIIILRFTQVAACIISSYATNCLSIHLLVDIWVVFRFQLLQIKLQWVFVCMSLFGNMLSFLLGTSVGAEWLDHMVDTRLMF